MRAEEVNRLHSFCHYRPPKVSVVIPCYNAEKYIKDCILSVLKQDYRPIEIIVVDDASTDSSVAKISELLVPGNPIFLFRNPVNVGECKTSASGFAAASGEYVCRLSADDMFVNHNHISIQVEEMERYGIDWCYNNRNLVGCDVLTSTETQTPWVPIPVRYSAKFFSVFDNLFLSFPNICCIIAIVRNPINSSAMMIRSVTYHKMLSWDSHLRSICDGSLIYTMLLAGLKCRAIPTAGVFYRTHPGQATGKKETNFDLEEARWAVRDEIKNNEHPLWMKLAVRFFYG